MAAIGTPLHITDSLVRGFLDFAVPPVNTIPNLQQLTVIRDRLRRLREWQWLRLSRFRHVGGIANIRAKARGKRKLRGEQRGNIVYEIRDLAQFGQSKVP